MLNKVLCIDDDPITLMLCKKVISKAEFSKTIDSVNNGEQALLYFKEILEIKETINNIIAQIPEFTLLDLNMPVMNGWEFLDSISTKEFEALHPFLKIIILSSSIDPKDIERSKKYPIVIKFLSKPITKEKLNSIL